MIYSKSIDEKTGNSIGSIEFNSGLKIRFSTEETIEFDNKLRETRAEVKLKEKDRITSNVLPALQMSLDMAIKEEKTALSTYYINIISNLTGSNPYKIIKMSEERTNK